MLFRDRVDAGRQLAERLREIGDEDLVVLGLPRGGVPVAAEVARVLRTPSTCARFLDAEIIRVAV